MAHHHLADSRHEATLTAQVLARLRSMDTQGDRVLSVYLGFDPSQMPNLRERRIEADSLLQDAERRYGGDGAVPHAARMALREDIQGVRDLLADDEELAPEGAHGLAIFCAARPGICEIVRLTEPVDPLVAFERRPFLEPLVELSASERWCVLLVSRRASRIFAGTRARFIDVADVLDDVHRRHDQGGWSQARYQRAIEHEVDAHIRGACTRLFEHWQHRPFDHLLVAGPAELHPRVEDELQPELRARLAGCFQIDVERADAQEVRRRALVLIETEERAREQEALGRLHEGLAPSGHAATGMDDVLELLNEGRVQTLIVAHGFATQGFVCPRCGRLGAVEGSCPLDGESVEPQENVVGSTIELALADSADVLVVRHEREQLAAHGSIAALVRY
jgi:peptide chain release factor subunit 1